MSGMGTCARCSKSNNISQHQQNDSKYAEKPVWQGGRTKEDKVLHLCGRGDSVDRYESKEEENTVLIHVLIHAYCVLMHRKFYITCISKPKYSNKVFSEKCLVKKKQLKKRDYVAFM